jgi:hypothetical protein
MTYAGCLLAGGVLGVVLLAATAFAVSELCDRSLW